MCWRKQNKRAINSSAVASDGDATSRTADRSRPTGFFMLSHSSDLECVNARVPAVVMGKGAPRAADDRGFTNRTTMAVFIKYMEFFILSFYWLQLANLFNR
ncbi:hypothetical protein EVAR_76912_1 [Eumeta japonica]|uniref:Uncharacterized protein n=1 Tax=Eumeta variegata TaxID=151549 RepID=A0A4C1SHN4_EUMVA|nr:hypothetical protein EVAR_76912_1 [Eumeta japonica]